MFGKFFAQTFTGSMYGAGAVVFAVWSYTIANKDEDGELELNPNLLGGMIGCDPKEIQEAIDYLAAPDPGSRSEKEEGRRIIGIGHRFMYRVVNHEEFLAIARREHLRMYNREKKRQERERKRDGDVKGQSVDVKRCQGSDVHVDVDVDGDVSEKTTSSSSRKDDDALIKFVLNFWKKEDLRPRVMTISQLRRRSILARKREHGEANVKLALENRANSRFLCFEIFGGKGAPVDWLFGPKNFSKVIDGNYNDLIGGTNGKGPKGKSEYDSVL